MADRPGPGPLLRAGGHALALAAVRRAIDTVAPPHALLLVGPRGVGKTTLALDLAAGLQCLDPEPTARPCRACTACRKVEHGNHPDVHRLAPDGAGEQLRLGQVQALIADLALLPLEGRLRVAILERAHRLNPDAQNALLKTLEEPVGQTCICLCADDAAPLLPTIVSRTVRLRLGPLPVATVARILVDGAGVDPARARALAVASDGRPGVALALAERPDAALVRSRLARSLLDLLAADRRARLGASEELVSDGVALDAALRGETPSAAGRRQPAERRRAVLQVLGCWRDVSRDLAVACAGGERHLRDMDLLEDLRAAARGLELGALLGFVDRLDALSAAVEAYAAPELVLDVLLLTWPRPAGGTRTGAASPGRRRAAAGAAETLGAGGRAGG